MSESISLSESELLPRDKVFELQRVARLWRYVAVVGCTWFSFAIFYWFRGFTDAVLLCTIQAAVCFVFRACRPLLKRSPFTACHCFLLICLIGLVAMTLVNDCGQRESIYFLSLGIFLASQLLGVSGALSWMVIVCLATMLRYSFNPDQHTVLINNNDSLVNALLLSGAIFFICHQAESLFSQRTQRLKKLTRDLHQQNERNHHLAITDALTGLSNRYGIEKICREQLDVSLLTGNELAMIVIDFDKFKEINDTLGHQVGDELLEKIAGRLEQQVGDRAFVGRLGGDEFCILIPDVGEIADAMGHAVKIHRTLCQPYRIGTEVLKLNSSMGISLCPSQSTNSVELLMFADTAMYRAKIGETKCLLYDPSMTDEIRGMRELKEQLSNAIERDEFYLVYQPQLCFETGVAFGAEALIRWRRDGEEILPWKFIPALESSGLIIPVGRWVIEEACRQLGEWQQKGYRYTVSVNVSAAQFVNENFVDDVRESIERYGVDPELLDLEITESILIENIEEVIDRLNLLKRIGCTISVDDFGTGYSSLAYLKRFPIDRLKIDREFVKDYPESDDGIVASSVVALAQALDLRVLAEGVETPQQFQFLRDCGCEEYQGYICSKPVEPEACEKLFLEFNSFEEVKKLVAAENEAADESLTLANTKN